MKVYILPLDALVYAFIPFKYADQHWSFLFVEFLVYNGAQIKKHFNFGFLIFTSQGRKEGPSLSVGEGIWRVQEERFAEVVSEENRRLPGNHTVVLSHMSSCQIKCWSVIAHIRNDESCSKFQEYIQRIESLPQIW